MPLAYLILQSVMLQFHHALLCGLDLSHPMVQHDLLHMISFLLGDQPHDAHMEEAIPDAAAPQSPGPASPLPAPAPCPVYGYPPMSTTRGVSHEPGLRRRGKDTNTNGW
jgi:hypothetical protein